MTAYYLLGTLRIGPLRSVLCIFTAHLTSLALSEVDWLLLLGSPLLLSISIALLTQPEESLAYA